MKDILSRLGMGNSARDGGPAARLVAAAPAIVTLLLVIALAAQLASFVWQLLAPTPAAVERSSAPAPTTRSAADVAGIINAHLFGAADLPASAGGAPASNLRLVLAGTLAGPDPASGWAIVGETAQAAKVYQTGATLPGGVRLREVYPDRIVIERGTRLETIALPRQTAAAVQQQTGYRASQSPQPSLADSVRTLVQQDPGLVSEIIRPQPVFAGGQQKGYRLYPGRNRAQFASLGLMPGDLVTAVNGTPLDDPNRGLETLRGINAGGPVTLTIERNGAEQQLTVDTATILPAATSADSDAQPAGDDEE